jgi:molecular chaperone IbpA|tara:strand:+ start:210 stop:620 length:411 start_codon:yes stop_codon:yes gene_type:complete
MQIQSTLLDNYTIGFESLFNDLETIRLKFAGNYPPHNITKIDSSNFKLSLAVAGFAKEELSITETDGLLSIKGAKKENKDSKFLYHGIAERDFHKQFKLGEYMEVSDSELTNGILTLSLKKELPESKQPKTINIKQ